MTFLRIVIPLCDGAAVRAGDRSAVEALLESDAALAGARNDQRELDLRRLLLRFRLLRFDAAADFDAAARIYRRCRGAGFTPRGMVDCMIAAVAWRHGAALLAQDVDLQRLGLVIGIELDRVSPTR